MKRTRSESNFSSSFTAPRSRRTDWSRWRHFTAAISLLAAAAGVLPVSTASAVTNNASFAGYADYSPNTRTPDTVNSCSSLVNAIDLKGWTLSDSSSSPYKPYHAPGWSGLSNEYFVTYSGTAPGTTGSASPCGTGQFPAADQVPVGSVVAGSGSGSSPSVTVTSSDVNVVVDYVAIHGGQNQGANPERIYWGPLSNFTATGLQSQGSFSNVYIFFHLVSPASTSTATTMTGSNGTITPGTALSSGASISDTATVSPTPSSTSTPPSLGTVTFTLYSGGTCSLNNESVYTASGGSLYAESGALSLTANGTATWGSNAILTAANVSLLPAGSYYFVAVYSGTTGFNGSTSPCEPFSVSSTSPPTPPTPPTPPLVSLSTTPIVSGTGASDSATVSGTGRTPTGKVTFTLYSGSPGSGQLVTSFAADTVTLVNGSASSSATGGLVAGSYYFMVTYSGDGTYSSITPGTAEPFTIALRTASLSTTPTPVGLSATDSATVLGGASGMPTGSVTFTLYQGTPGSGTQVTSYSDTVSLSSTGTASSMSTGRLRPGSYYFMVTYSGDGTYSSITPGTAEPFTIIAVSPPKPPKKPKKPTVPPYKIPTKPPKTGFGGSARMVYNGGLLAGGGSVLLAGLAMLAYAMRRRRRL